MKNSLKFMSLSTFLLGSFLATLISVATPSQADAITCTGGQVAIKRVASAGGMSDYINSVNGAGGEYAQCVTPVNDCANSNQVRIAGTAGNNCYDLAGNQQVISCGAGNSPIRQGPRANSEGGDVEACRPEAINDTPACRQKLGNNNVIAVVVPGRGFDVERDCRQLISTSNQGSDPAVGQDDDGVIEGGMGTTPGDGDDTEGEGTAAEKEEPTCGTMATNVGWYMCPLLNAGTDFADGMWGFFESMLIIPPLSAEGDTAALYSVWGTLRNFANVILTIIFLAVIFSQVSNVGISNYGVKKMLPKILITAVAINVSFFIMQIAVDLSNILTVVSGDLIRSAAGDIEPGKEISNVAGEIMGTLIGAAAVGGGIGLAMGATGSPLAVIVFLVLLMIPIVFGLLAGVLTLALRSLLLPILVIFAPIAFALQLLPNTKKLADKWTSITMGLLLFSVIAAIMYDGALLVLSLVIATTNEPIIRITAIASLFLLMFFLPFLAFKVNPLTAKAFNGLRKGMNKISSPATGAARKYSTNAMKRGASAKLAKFKSRETPPRRRYDPRRVTDFPRKALRAADMKKRDQEMSTAMYEQVMAQQHREGVLTDSKKENMREEMKQTSAGRAYLDKFEAEAQANAEQRFLNKDNTFMEEEFAKAAKNNDTVTMNAILSVKAKTGGDPGPSDIKKLLNDNYATLEKNGTYEDVMNRLANNHGDLMGRDLVLKEMMVNMYAEDGKTVTPMSPNTAKENVASQAKTIMRKKMPPEKFAALTSEQKEFILSDPAFRPHIDNSLLTGILDESKPGSGNYSPHIKAMARNIQAANNAPNTSNAPRTQGVGSGFSPQQGAPAPSTSGQAPSAQTPGTTSPALTNRTVNNTTNTTNNVSNTSTSSTTAIPGVGSGFSQNTPAPSPTGQAPSTAVNPQPAAVTNRTVNNTTNTTNNATTTTNVSNTSNSSVTAIPGIGSGFSPQQGAPAPSTAGQAPNIVTQPAQAPVNLQSHSSQFGATPAPRNSPPAPPTNNPNSGPGNNQGQP